MSTVRGKFKCSEVAQVEGGTNRVSLYPVVSGSEENKQFFKWSPGGKIELAVVNPDTAALFEPGKEYYVDFTPAEVAQ